MVRRRLHPGCAPLRYGGKGSPPCFAPGKVPVSSPRPRKSLDRLLEGVARAEGGNLLGRDLHLLPGLGVSALPGLALLDGELTEARDLDLLAGLKRLGHHLLEGLEVLLGLALGHVGLLCDPLDELLLLHGYSFLWSTWATWRTCSGCLPSCLYGSRGQLPPPCSRWVWRSGCCGGVLWEMHHIWYGLLGKANG